MNTQVIKNGRKAELIIDGNCAGFLEVSSEGMGSYRIENTEIEKEYRGKGLYKVLLASVFNLFGCDILRSEQRNINSNSCYRYWTGNQSLEQTSVVWIENVNGKLIFTED